MDWFLELLVKFVNTGFPPVAVTLTVGGTIVSGYLISAKDYFEAFADEFTSSWPDDPIADEIKGQFKKFGVVPKKEQNRFNYIHLRDARFFHPGQPAMPGNRGVLWRSRIAAIDGFCLGQLGAAPDTSTAETIAR